MVKFNVYLKSNMDDMATSLKTYIVVMHKIPNINNFQIQIKQGPCNFHDFGTYQIHEKSRKYKNESIPVSTFRFVSTPNVSQIMLEGNVCTLLSLNKTCSQYTLAFNLSYMLCAQT